MVLELVQAKLGTMAPVLDLIRNTFKAERICLSPDTWEALIVHFSLPIEEPIPPDVHLWVGLKTGQVFLLPRNQFLELELVA